MDWVNILVILTVSIFCEISAIKRIKSNQEWMSEIFGGDTQSNRQDDNCGNCICGQSLNTNNNTRIVGGQPAEELKYPWMVLIKSADADGIMLCGGSLINDKYVLCAAHCITAPKENTTLTFGAVDALDSTNQIVHKVDSFIIHPNYDDLRLKNDIALIKLEEPINLRTADRIGTICLPPEGPDYLGVNATVTGWGLTSGNGVPSRVLLEVHIPVPDDENCKKIWPRFDETLMCFGTKRGTQGACRGDSGGPLMIQNSTLGAMQQIGVVSYGTRSCSTYSVFTRLNKFLDFITTNTADACKCNEPVQDSEENNYLISRF